MSTLARLGLLPLFLFLFSSLQAQVFEPNISIGIASLAPDLTLDRLRLNARTGFTIGADLRTGYGHYYFVPGLHYLMLRHEASGSKADGEVVDGVDLTHHWLQAPIFFGYRVLDPSFTVNAYVEGGLAPMLLLGRRAGTLEDLDANRFNLVFTIGPGLDLGPLTLTFRHEWNLLKWYDGANAGRQLVWRLGVRFLL